MYTINQLTLTTVCFTCFNLMYFRRVLKISMIYQSMMMTTGHWTSKGESYSVGRMINMLANCRLKKDVTVEEICN